MRRLQKPSVAILITLVMILMSIGVGQWRSRTYQSIWQDPTWNENLPTSDYDQLIRDPSGVLTREERQKISLYNANWMEHYGRLIAVDLVPSIKQPIAKYAHHLGKQLKLGRSDGVLVIDLSKPDAFLAVGAGYPMSDEEISDYLNQYLYRPVMAGEFGRGILALFDEIHNFYRDGSEVSSGIWVRPSGILLVLLPMIAIFIIFALSSGLPNRRPSRRQFSRGNWPLSGQGISPLHLLFLSGMWNRSRGSRGHFDSSSFPGAGFGEGNFRGGGFGQGFDDGSRGGGFGQGFDDSSQGGGFGQGFDDSSRGGGFSQGFDDSSRGGGFDS